MASFPRFSAQNKIGQQGINAVSTIINDIFGWIFRQNHQEHDFGIDGYFDVIDNDGNVTGQSIAVQIKTGKSYFLEENDFSYTYIGNNKHLNYYSNHSLPVILIIYDPETQQCLWDNFDIKKLFNRGINWTIEIPKSNILEKSKEKILNIVGRAADFTDEAQSHGRINNMLRDADFILYTVSRHDIENLVVSNIKDFINRIRSNEMLLRKFQGRIEISISGYDYDSRELWEIKLVRKWFKKADNVFIDWFYFLNLDTVRHTIKLYFACLCDPKRNSENNLTKIINVEMNPRKFRNLLNTNFVRLNTLTDSLQISEEKNKEISYQIARCLGLSGHGGPEN